MSRKATYFLCDFGDSSAREDIWMKIVLARIFIQVSSLAELLQFNLLRSPDENVKISVQSRTTQKLRSIFRILPVTRSPPMKMPGIFETTPYQE